MSELGRFVVLVVYGHQDRAEVLGWRGAVPVLVTVRLTPQVPLPHSHPGADNTTLRAVVTLNNISLQVVGGGQPGHTVSSSEDVSGSEEGAATPELEVREAADTVANVDQPGVLAQLRLHPVHYPALAHQSVWE